jgi:hypothetical protein
MRGKDGNSRLHHRPQLIRQILDHLDNKARARAPPESRPCNLHHSHRRWTSACRSSPPDPFPRSRTSLQARLVSPGLHCTQRSVIEIKIRSTSETGPIKFPISRGSMTGTRRPGLPAPSPITVPPMLESELLRRFLLPGSAWWRFGASGLGSSSSAAVATPVTPTNAALSSGPRAVFVL